MTENKNHGQMTGGLIDEQTTGAGGMPVTYKWIGEECSAGEKTVNMTSIIYIVAFALLGQARAEVVELNCGDNATCIDNMAKEFARSLRHQKSVKLFDLFTVEPLGNRQARSSQDPLTRLISTHGISFDWNDFTFRFSNPEGRSDALDLEVFESRSVKDVSDSVPKKSTSKDEEDVLEDKRVHVRPIKRRRHRRKVIQAVIPLLFGMKSAGVVIFGLFMVSVITIKAFLASKMALMVTLGMAMKKLYESYSTGVGLPNHPYLYSQYPIDFPSATSHTYSVGGVSPQFASPEMYGPSALGAHSHTHELLQQNDASAQQSQQAPTVIVNATQAAERWDGKSKLLKYLEPVVDKIRSFVDPIASVFYDAMPATFRGLNSVVSTAKNVEPELEAKLKRPKEYLIPQPRHIAQRKMSNKKTPSQRPKKYAELKVDLDRLKLNKDFLEYVKTKKYKHNYPHTYYYPRIKYYVNPTVYVPKPNNKRLSAYRKNIMNNRNILDNNNTTVIPTTTAVTLEASDWKPTIIYNVTNEPELKNNKTRKIRRKKIIKKRKRTKRNVDIPEEFINTNDNSVVGTNESARGFSKFLQFFTDPMEFAVKHVDIYAKNVIEDTLKPKKPPKYYSVSYNLLLFCLDAIEGLIDVHEAIHNHLHDDVKVPKTKNKRKKLKKVKRKTKPTHKVEFINHHQNNTF